MVNGVVYVGSDGRQSLCLRPEVKEVRGQASKASEGASRKMLRSDFHLKLLRLVATLSDAEVLRLEG